MSNPNNMSNSNNMSNPNNNNNNNNPNNNLNKKVNKPCRYFAINDCRLGTACPFRHDAVGEVKGSVPNTNANANANVNVNVNAAPRANGNTNKAPAPGVVKASKAHEKKKACKYFAAGSCFKGAECPFLHVENSLDLTKETVELVTAALKSLDMASKPSATTTTTTATKSATATTTATATAKSGDVAIPATTALKPAAVTVTQTPAPKTEEAKKAEKERDNGDVDENDKDDNDKHDNDKDDNDNGDDENVAGANGEKKKKKKPKKPKKKPALDSTATATTTTTASTNSESHDKERGENRDSSYTAKPLSSKELSAFESMVSQRRRAPIVPHQTTPSNTSMFSMLVVSQSERGNNVVLRGNYHRVLFTIEELEAPNAVEMMMEEMSDENMHWFDAVKTVGDIRCGFYKANFNAKTATRAEQRRRATNAVSPISLQSRVLEFLELSSMLFEGTRLMSEEEFISGLPPTTTNFSYWGIKTKAQWSKWVSDEMAFFATVPNIVSFVFEHAPWFYERGYFFSIMVFVGGQLHRHSPHYASDKELAERMSREVDRVQQQDGDGLHLVSWGRTRKPNTPLPPRPRMFFR